MTDNTKTENMPSVGIRPWGTLPKQQTRSFDREDLPRIPYMRLLPGFNSVRIISGMGAFFQVKIKLPTSKRPFGDKVRTSWPTYKDECPVKKFFGKEGRERYLVVVIDRADKQLKFLDLSQLTAQQVEDILEAKKKKKGNQITPQDFDISVKFDPKSKVATGFYSVVADDNEPMSEEDWELINSIGGPEVIDKCLQRQIVCPKPETVMKRLKDLGWDGNPVPQETKSFKKEAKLEEPEEEDYSFNSPDVPAEDEVSTA